MCVSPYITKNKKGELVPVPCGKCIECRKDFQNEWIFRLTQECKRSNFPAFVTLTYKDRYLPLGDSDFGVQSCVDKRDLQLFFKRLRKIGGEYLEGMRYFSVSEYGSKRNRAHHHAIIIAPKCNIQRLRAFVDKAWRVDGKLIGWNYTKFAEKKQIHYLCKYMNKLDERPHLVKPFRLFSRGIGLCYLTETIVKYYLTTFDRTCISGKFRIKLPRYYQRKLDDISQSFESFKRSGLNYSDLRKPIERKKGSKYDLFMDFCERYEKHCEDLIPKVQIGVDALGDPVYTQLHNFSVNQLFTMYCNKNKFLSNLRDSSDRLIEKCIIKNRLRGYQPVTEEYLEPI